MSLDGLIIPREVSSRSFVMSLRIGSMARYDLAAPRVSPLGRVNDAVNDPLPMFGDVM